ncbi:MAG TPA: ATP-binding protein [Pyrinomonadaceae bacterium]|jgi:signal transduction histidine kinase/ActR/RegA family two-component response regulator|nr:ATP-binding protein [Pyrinomonadaceae bacterium]
MENVGTRRFALPFLRMIIVLGVVAYVLSLRFLPFSRLDTRFLILALLTLGVGSRFSIKIPRVSAHISVSDSFIFLTLLLFGGEAAVVVAALDGFFTSLRFSRKPLTLLFNGAVVAFSTFVTAEAVWWSVGDVVALTSGRYTPAFVLALSVMAFVQYAFNSGIVAVGGALKDGRPVWQTWRKNYLWTSVTYFAGAFAAGGLAEVVGFIGFYAFVGTLPILGIVYFTYLTYLKHVETSAAQAEQAQRHVEELSHYIAEQDRLRREQEEMREQFTQLEKMSALGELASGVAHDFNNTLAGILGRAQLVLRTSDPEKIRKGLQIIIKTAEDGARTVKRIQDFARQRRSQDFAPVATDQLLIDVKEMTRPRWKDSAEAHDAYVRVVLGIESNSFVMGDESELREVLVNMIFNAVDAMPRGGTLTLASRDEGDHVLVSVSDTGCGMSHDVRSRIFDPFFTTKGKAGMGLGLAVSYGIVHRHEGTVEVQSEVDRGTTFTIRLPLARGVRRPDPVEELAADSFTPAEIAGARARVLVVDDEQHVRELLADILESEGCEAVTCASGNEAAAILGAGDFDAVFTDIGMPGMSGWELARLVRERDADIPVAVITGWGESVGSEQQQAARVDWVVSKPFSMKRIVEIVRELEQRDKTARAGQLAVA